MQLSEAVVLGFLDGVRKRNDQWAFFGMDSKICSGCLVGSALEACGVTMRDFGPNIVMSIGECGAALFYLSPDIVLDEMERRWPWLKKVHPDDIPFCCCAHDHIFARGWALCLTKLMSAHLHHGFSLEWVSEEIRHLEEKYEEKPEQKVVELSPEVLVLD